MIRKLTTRDSQNSGIEKRMLQFNINCSPTICIPYCGGLRDVAFDNMEALLY